MRDQVPLTLSGSQPDFSSYTKRHYNTRSLRLDWVKLPLSKMAASSFLLQHSFLNNIYEPIIESAYTHSLEEICREIQMLWDIE